MPLAYGTITEVIEFKLNLEEIMFSVPCLPFAKCITYQ